MGVEQAIPLVNKEGKIIGDTQVDLDVLENMQE